MAGDPRRYSRGRPAGGGWRLGVVEVIDAMLNTAGFCGEVLALVAFEWGRLIEELEQAASKGDLEKFRYLVGEVAERCADDSPEYDVPSPDCWEGGEDLFRDEADASDSDAPVMETALWNWYDGVVLELSRPSSGKRGWSARGYGRRGRQRRTDKRDRAIRRYRRRHRKAR